MVEERSCTNCGRIIPSDAILCPYCGKKFYETEQTNIKKHTGYGIASLTIGIIAMCLIWLAFTPFYLFIHMPLGILSLIFGIIANNRYNDKFGLAGAILGILVLILGLIFFLIGYSYYTWRLF